VTDLPAPPERPRRLAYLGTPGMAVAPLELLHAAGPVLGFEVVLVVSAADTRRGRGGSTSPSPVKEVALARGLAVTDRVDDLLDADVDLGVVVAFGRIIRPHVLAQVPMVNLHFSLLPRWRGAAPVERALLAGDDVTGVCLMAVEEGLDTGGVYRRSEVPIGPETTADELRQALVTVGGDQLLDALRHGFGPAEPQVGEATYAEKLTPADLALGWYRPADEVHRVVRVGGAHTTFRGERFGVVAAERWAEVTPALSPGELRSVGGVELVGTGTEPLRLRRVQPAGRKVQSARDWWNGARLGEGECLGRP
jgi:methionyl-tRNA formyltransferase